MYCRFFFRIYCRIKKKLIIIRSIRRASSEASDARASK